MVLQRVVKPKTHKGRKFLENREPKIEENDKVAMFIKGGNTSQTVSQVLKEMYMLKKPTGIMMKRKNVVRPFEDQTTLEYFSEKNDASLFLFGSHSKKRPHNLVLGRFFDHHILDMVELGIENFRSMFEFQNDKCSHGTKPCVIFSGQDFEQLEDYAKLKSLLMDFFRGPKTEKIRLSGLELVLQVTAVDNKIYFRTFRTVLKKSGTKIPRVELEEIGPSLDWVVKRSMFGSDDLYKRANKKPSEAKKSKTQKNKSRTNLGDKMGRIHMQKQNLDTLQTRKMKGLKRKKGGDEVEGEAGEASESTNEKLRKMAE
ncbi:ribosome production factor 2 homolog [Patella vulgata]|uniref:ribosome production factor 2 homolog n=1 Tax=Patella vulgata TaxID=6465 RepID=UPI00217F5292|nr:ribosome production factor 2 homolog [Patella vulgata]